MTNKMLYQQKLFSNRDYDAEAVFLARLLKSMKIVPNSRILDIGSNRGDHSLALSKIGFKVTGIDTSGMFVDYAQKRVKAAKFLLADMKSFKSDQPFDAAIAIFNGIYFNRTRKELLAALKNISTNIRKGGALIFDINTPLLKDFFSQNKKSVLGHSEKNLQIARFDEVTRKGNQLLFKFNYLVRDGAQFHTYSNQIRFGFFSIAELKSAARKSGFKSVEILKDKEFRPGSTCFVCRK